MKKKFLSIVAGVVVAVVGGVALSACGQMHNDFITAKKGDVELGGANFVNSANLVIDYCQDNKYEAKGDVSVMSAEQANAFWAGTAQEGDNYVVLSVKFNVGSTLTYGFVSDNANFETPDGLNVKSYTNNTSSDDTLDIILRVKKDKTTFKVVDKEQDKDSVTYTVDMSKLTYKTQE